MSAGRGRDRLSIQCATRTQSKGEGTLAINGNLLTTGRTKTKWQRKI